MVCWTLVVAPTSMDKPQPNLPTHDGALDLVGVGIGPANLSLAALLERRPALARLFLDAKPSFSWHTGLMLSGTSTQVHFLKDLVSLVDPTSRFSFPAFLSAKRRLYRALVAERAHVPRGEFEEYYRWVADALPGLAFGEDVQAVDWAGDRFVVLTAERVVPAHNLVLGVGARPDVPECAGGLLGGEVFHASEYLKHAERLAGLRVLVVGGGQSAAEVVHDLLGRAGRRPAQLVWVTRRANFLPLDESPFTNELFLPNHSRAFFRLPHERRARALGAQKLASDGVKADLLLTVYRQLYEIDCLEGDAEFARLGVGQEIAGIARRSGGVEAALRDVETGDLTTVTIDRVVLATGYRQAEPELLGPLLPRIARDEGGLVVRSDFSVAWDGPPQHRIYVQNAARHRFGIADPNLSLVAWRSAVIVNSLAGEPVYDTGDVSSALTWGPPGHDRADPAPELPSETWARAAP
jgi:lysine N6-hydroxylase